MPPTKVGILLKKRSVHFGWRPCYVKLDKRENVLEYFSYKYCKMTPKYYIDMKSVEIFIEQMPREKPIGSEEGEFYLHFIWNKSEEVFRKKSIAKMSIFAKRNSKVAPLKEARIDEETDVRNLYFWPTTDRECFEWYFALLSAKFDLLNTNTFKGSRYSSPLVRSNSASSSNTYYQIAEPAIPPKSTLVPITDSNPDYTEITESPAKPRVASLSDIDLFCHFPDATSEFVRRTSCIVPEADLLEISGLYTANKKESDPFFVSCIENEFSPLEVTHEDEIESDSYSAAPNPELFLDSSFYSCPPKKDTNPFEELTRKDDKREVGRALPAQSSPFRPKDATFIYEDPIYELGADNPVFGEDSSPTINFQAPNKDSWINGAVRVSETQTDRLTSVDSEEYLDEQDRVFDPPSDPRGLYGSIREDMTLNRSFYFKSGWLSKVGERRGDRWRARWFTLYNHHLTYSESQFSAYPNGQLNLGSDQKGFGVDFSTSMIHLVPAPTHHTFCIRTPTRRYYLCALTERDQREWFEVISRVIALAYVLK